MDVNLLTWDYKKKDAKKVGYGWIELTRSYETIQLYYSGKDSAQKKAKFNLSKSFWEIFSIFINYKINESYISEIHRDYYFQIG